MEQELNNYEINETDLYHFKLIHKNQKLNLNDNKRYQDWKNNAIYYINEKNNNNTNESFLLCEFCDNCCSYSIFRMNHFSLIECLNCKYKMCIGCHRVPISNEDYSTCLKGFLITCYLRAFNEGTDIIVHEPILFILHIIFSLLFTPLYIGFIFNMLGFLMHQKKSRLYDNGKIHDFTDNSKKLLSLHIFSIIKGFLFFPYIIIFIPFIIILLLPSIFSKKYYLKVFTFYITVVTAGGMEVKERYW